MISTCFNFVAFHVQDTLTIDLLFIYYRGSYTNPIKELRMTSITYNLKHIGKDPVGSETYTSNMAVKVGDVIEVDTSDFHYISRIKELKSAYQLVISEPCNTYDMAYQLAIQQGFRLG